MTNLRTVSDTKRAFYSYHSRPINSLYRRVVEELMVEMHLLSVNVDFVYNPLYALGVVTSFDRFMVGYEPAQDKESIFAAICRSVEGDPQQYRQHAEAFKADLSGLALGDLQTKLDQAKTSAGDGLQGKLNMVATQANAKYSRLMAVGLYTLFETVDAAALDDKEKREEMLKTAAEMLALPADKVDKDLELYRSNLEKMAQAQEVMKDILAAERKKREQRAQAKQEAAATTDAGETPSAEPTDSTP
ncbi:photosystem II biogenesis protein Psp29 [Leptothoe kymatousa TAU-MAC 1615]|uniref:Protein Thf1 n=1 Tax=Leptothoe kymatousa TAU-MAC 1615 TaxID=2364775 RepID=A0ABS5Y0N5_9CYAN|nr:photosystem II biogenesis protein Psp29 [Leptothoe kymatousa]MBT9311397.1 photosystem II biogenesis protein Psp29 [Leptothoe kymatousa TAU-MAC 1615]